MFGQARRAVLVFLQAEHGGACTGWGSEIRVYLLEAYEDFRSTFIYFSLSLVLRST
jgi:hypothetical protein